MPKLFPKQTYLAVDAGASSVKVIGDNVKYTFPSLIAYPDLVRVLDTNGCLAPDVFKYLSGSSNHLQGKIWITGYRKIILRGLQPCNPGQDATLKLENALPLFLSSLIDKGIAKAGDDQLTIVISHHQAALQKDKLKASFIGNHTVEKGGIVYNFEITIPKRGIFNEGEAATYTEDFSLVDLGFLTTLVSDKTAEGTTLDSRAYKTGVHRLVEMLSEDPQVLDCYGAIAPLEPIQAALANPNSSKIIFKDLERKITFDMTEGYTRCLKKWLAEALKPVMKDLEMHKGTGYKVFSIGGGNLLPKVKQFLLKLGIEVYDDDPLYTNASTLFNNELKKVRHQLEEELKRINNQDL